MKSLVQHIRYLLTQHDCVIVPGWGALVVQHCAAEYGVNNTLLPPRRWLSFNPLLTHNDGMLAHSLMRAERCSYEEAILTITEQVTMWRNEMKSGKNVVWDRIGRYEYQDNGAILFAEADDVEVNASLSMLQPLSLTHLVDVLPALQDDDKESESASTATVITWRRQVWRAVASVAAIVVMMLCISTPIDNYEASNDYASLVAGEILGYSTELQPVADVEELAVFQSVEKQAVVDGEAFSVAEAVVEEEDDKAIDVVARGNSSTAPILSSTTLPRYILVVGSLPTQSLAQKQIAEFQQSGIEDDIKIYESNGKYRLYIEGYDTMQQARKQLALLTSQTQSPFAGIWICATR